MSKIWWETLAGPGKIVQDIYRSMINGRMLRVLISSDFPFIDEFRSACENRINRDIGRYTFDYIDFEQFTTTEVEIQDFILKRFAREDDYRAYRPINNYFDYLFEKKILDKRAVWITGVPEDQSSILLKFQETLAKRSKGKIDHGILIVEVITNSESRHETPNIDILNYSDYVSEFDVMLYASLLTRERGLSVNWQKYYVYLVTSLSGLDPELCEALIDDEVLYEAEPIALIERHNKLQEELFAGKVWKAQIQLLLHLIEEERCQFLDQHEEVLSRLIPIEDQFVGTIDNVSDLELRHIKNIVNNHTLAGIDHRAETRILFLLKVRNQLAHMVPISLKDVKELIDKGVY